MEKRSTVQVWDIPTRLFHWLLVLLIAFSWYTGTEGIMEWHMRSGYAILTLIVFRLLWGLFGSQTARFAQFVKGPKAVLAYARALLTGHPPHPLGHNPLGTLMIIALLLLVGVQASTGLFANDDIFTDGPLTHLVSKETSDELTVIHKTVFDLLLAFAAVHIAANLIYRFLLKQDLITPMITGRTTSSAGQAAPRLRSPLLALVLLCVAAGAVYWVVTRL